MKRQNILLSMILSLCLGMAAGCGETKYLINAKVSSSEYGYIKGGGKFKNGAEVNLKIYPQYGCTPTKLVFTKSDSQGGSVDITNLQNKGDFYGYTFQLKADVNVGSYEAQFSCQSNSIDNARGEKPKIYLVNISDENGNILVEGSESINVENDYNISKVVDSIEVNLGAKLDSSRIETISYMDGIPGKISWKIKNSVNSFNFEEEVISGDIFLYGVVDTNNAKSHLETAFTNFKNSTNIKMESNNTSIALNLNNEKDSISVVDVRKMNFLFKEGDTSKYMISESNYYEYSRISSPIYKMNLGEDIDIYSIKEVQQFLGLFLNYNGDYTVRIVKNNNKIVNETINEKKCVKYELLDGEDIIYTIWINKGIIYQIQTAGENKIAITYTDVKFNAPNNTIPMYYVKLFSNSGELNYFLQEINSDVDNLLKVVPSNSENLENVIYGNEQISILLKKYAHIWKYQNFGGIIEDLKKEKINSNNNLYVEVDVNNTFDKIINGINNLILGGVKIKTETTVFGEIASKEHFISLGQNVFEDDTINSTIQTILDRLNKLKEASESDSLSNYPYYKFTATVDISNSNKVTYSFYENETSQKPYLEVYLEKISEDTNVITGFVCEIYGENNMAYTYTTTFDYSYRNVINAINDLKVGNFNVLFDQKQYIEEDGVNLLVLSEKPNDMDESLWNVIKELNYITDLSMYELDNSVANNYKFTSKEDENIVYTIVLENMQIKQIIYKDETKETLYTFSYPYRQYLAALSDLSKGNFIISDGEIEFIENESRDILIADTRPPSMQASLWNVIQALPSLAKSSLYTLDTSVVNTYKFISIADTNKIYNVVVENGQLKEIKYSDGTSDYVYTIDYPYRKHIEALEQLRLGSYIISLDGKSLYEVEDGNDLLSEVVKPTNMDDNLWNVIQELKIYNSYDIEFSGKDTYVFTHGDDITKGYDIILEEGRIKSIIKGDKKYIFHDNYIQRILSNFTDNDIYIDNFGLVNINDMESADLSEVQLEALITLKNFVNNYTTYNFKIQENENLFFFKDKGNGNYEYYLVKEDENQKVRILYESYSEGLIETQEFLIEVRIGEA